MPLCGPLVGVKDKTSPRVTARCLGWAVGWMTVLFSEPRNMREGKVQEDSIRRGQWWERWSGKDKDRLGLETWSREHWRPPRDLRQLS